MGNNINRITLFLNIIGTISIGALYLSFPEQFISLHYVDLVPRIPTILVMVFGIVCPLFLVILSFIKNWRNWGWMIWLNL
ncbi:MAG: hypothetical protein AAB397_02930, partial [Patescibacteria group bacterium]